MWYGPNAVPGTRPTVRSWATCAAQLFSQSRCALVPGRDPVQRGVAASARHPQDSALASESTSTTRSRRSSRWTGHIIVALLPQNERTPDRGPTVGCIHYFGLLRTESVWKSSVVSRWRVPRLGRSSAPLISIESEQNQAVRRGKLVRWGGVIPIL